MIKKRIAAVVLFVLTIVSFPLCCFSTMSLVPNLLFRGDFEIVNRTRETLYVTPLGEAYGRRFALIGLFSRFPYLGLFRRADIRLKPGASIHVVCEIDEDLIFSEIVVRNEAGEYRQKSIDDPSLKLISRGDLDSETTGPIYAIESFSALPLTSPKVQEAVEKARRFDAGRWLTLSMGLVPLILLIVWLRVIRALQVESREKTKRDAQG